MKTRFFLSGTGCRAIQCTWAGIHHFPASPFVMVSQVQLSSKSWPLLMEYNQCIAFKSMSAWRLLKIYKRLKFLPHREIPPLYKYYITIAIIFIAIRFVIHNSVCPPYELDCWFSYVHVGVWYCLCVCEPLWGADDKTESKGMVRIYKSIGKWIYLSNPSRNKKPMKRVQQKSTILEGIQSWTNKAGPIVCPTTRKPSFLFRNEFLLIFQLPLPYITEKQNHDILQCTTRSAHSSLQHTLWHTHYDILKGKHF